MPRLCASMQLAVGAAALVAIAAGSAEAGEITSSCCLPNGSCADLDLGGCEQQGGTPQPGVSCNGASCGACCVPEENSFACTSALATNCTFEQGRAFHGPGTTCASVGGCPLCRKCTGGGDCSNDCQDGTSIVCPTGCVTSVAFDTCEGACQTSGCCEVTFRDTEHLCVLSDPLICGLTHGEFHPGWTCNPDSGRCQPVLCCRCTGDNPDACGTGQCQDNCNMGVNCPPPCVAVATTGTCDSDGCVPTGCCSIVFRDTQVCAESDADVCTFFGGTFFPGGMCDSTSGVCQVPSPSVTPTMPTVTPSETRTATVTAAPTSTRVPEGGACTDTSQCAPALLCLDNVCTATNAPAPAASGLGLVVALGALIAIAAVSLRRLAIRRL